MSSGYNPPPYKPPDTINPLAILSLIQEREKMDMTRKAFQVDQEKKAAESYLDAIKSGVDPEVAAHATPGLTVPYYNLGLEVAKGIKKQEAAKQALSPQSLAAISQSAGGTISPRNEWIPPSEENLAAIRQTYTSLPELLGPQAGYAAQNVINQLVGGAQAQQQQEAALRRAAESQTKRVSSYQEALQREGQRISQERAANLSDAAQRRTMDRDALAEVYASRDPEAIRRANETLYAGLPAAEASRLIQRAGLDGDAVALKKRQQGLTSPGGEFLETREAIRRWNEGDRAQDVVSTLQAKKLVIENPAPPRSMANDPKARWIWAEGSEQSIKSLSQIRGVDSLIDSLEGTAYAIEGVPEQARMVHGISGSQVMSNVRRGLAQEGTLVASLGTKLIEMQKMFAAIGNVGQISDWEQMMAALMGPLRTEIIGADGKVSDAFRGKIAAARDMAERARIAAVDPQARAQLERETQAALAPYNAEQRRALKAYSQAVSAGDAKAIAAAEKRMDASGASAISERQSAALESRTRERAAAEADAWMRRSGAGPAGAATP